MSWYYYLNYRIYKYYQRKKDLDPLWKAYWVPVVLLGVNLMALLGIMDLVFDFMRATQPSKYYVIIPIAVFALVNYLLLYRNKRYEEVFWEIEQNYKHYQHWDRSILWYVILSIVLMFVVPFLAGARNEGWIDL